MPDAFHHRSTTIPRAAVLSAALFVIACAACFTGCGGGGGGGGGPVEVPAGLTLNTTSVQFQAPQGGPDPALRTVAIGDTFPGDVHWYARSSSSWLSISKTEGDTPDSLSLAVSVGGIPAGSYRAKVWISSEGLDTRVIDVSLSVTDGAPPSAGDEWTILVYMNADNNVEQYALNDLNEMEIVGSSDKVNIIAIVDRSELSAATGGSGYSSEDGNWDTTRVYRILQDATPGQLNSELLFDDELNLGDPDELYWFLTTGVEEYPAARYAVVIWDHGRGWQALGVDDASTDRLTAVEVGGALRDAANVTGIGYFDLVVTELCLNSSFETAIEMSDVVNTYVGSEELMPVSGYDYDVTLGALRARPNMSDLELGERFARDYMKDASRFSGFSDFLTCSVIDLLLLPDTLTALDDFAAGMQATMATHSRFLARALRGGESFGSSQTDVDSPSDYFDIADLALIVGQSSTQPTIQQQAAALYESVQASIFYHDNSEDHFYSHGLMVYAPPTEAEYSGLSYAQTFFAQNTAWDEMLEAYYTRLALDTADPVIEDLFLSAATVSEAAPVTITAEFPGADTVAACLIGGQAEGEIFTFHFEIELPASQAITLPTGKQVAAWGDAMTFMDEEFDSLTLAVTDGTQRYLATVASSRTCFSVAARHRSAGLSDTKLVTLLFDCNGKFVRCYEAGDAENPREIRLAAGDALDILTRVIDSSGPGAPVVGTQVQGTLSGAPANLRLVTERVENGSYILGACAYDAAGNFTLVTETVTVEN